MRWKLSRRSGNIEDRRGGGGAIVGGGGSMFAVALLVYFLGGDPTPYLIEGAQRTFNVYQHSSNLSDEEAQEYAEFVSATLAGTEDVWRAQFQQIGETYRDPKLVLYTGGVNSACGGASAAMGPFYCPLDQKVYLDVGFFQELAARHNAPGDFAQAYVIAHEVGHHVQTLLGYTEEDMRNRQQARSQSAANQLSVNFELQADCLAGVWAHHLNQTGLQLEQGDIEEAMNAASQIGDDVLQQQGQGYVVPDSFTHGSSAQRQAAFMKGFQGGDLRRCE